jgi:hypothetical protein
MIVLNANKLIRFIYAGYISPFIGFLVLVLTCFQLEYLNQIYNNVYKRKILFLSYPKSLFGINLPNIIKIDLI